MGEVPEYTPACDLVCPVDARLFGDIEDPTSPVAAGGRRTRRPAQLKKEYGAGPQVYYVLEGGDF